MDEAIKEVIGFAFGAALPALKHIHIGITLLRRNLLKVMGFVS